MAELSDKDLQAILGANRRASSPPAASHGSAEAAQRLATIEKSVSWYSQWPVLRVLPFAGFIGSLIGNLAHGYQILPASALALLTFWGVYGFLRWRLKRLNLPKTATVGEYYDGGKEV